jgi:putative ABC transport system substrate-binding protein
LQAHCGPRDEGPAAHDVRSPGIRGRWGTLSYGEDIKYFLRRSAILVDKIFKGVKPADLPIEQPTRFFLTVNLKTAKAIGLDLPESFLLRADEVIE